MAAGGKTNNEPPELTPIDECVMDCLAELSGERNMSGNIPFRAIIEWGSWQQLNHEEISYYLDVINTSELKVKQWRSNST